MTGDSAILIGLLAREKQNFAVHRRLAQKMNEIWHERSALEYRECKGDHFDVLFMHRSL
ncbi:MAG: hypothetical protein HOP33_08675 [Verrucomicrobia bacterium]|nr:hypothetical protein [Verrucomicrobiota bacterium]